MKAIWNGQIVAESEDIVTVDGYQYFPRSAMKEDFFRQSDRTSECHCKGVARYWEKGNSHFDLVKGFGWRFVAPDRRNTDLTI